MMPPAPDPAQPDPATSSSVPPAPLPSAPISPSSALPPVDAPQSHEVDREEYYALLQDTTKLSDRRQSTNDLFVGLNVLFLTGMGFVVMSSHFTDWWPAAITGAIALFTILFNRIWLGLIDQYRQLVNLRIRYLQAVEERIGADRGWMPVVVHSEKGATVAVRGVYTLENQVLFGNGHRGFGFSLREKRLIRLFIVAYIVVFLLVCAVTLAVMYHYIPPFQSPIIPPPQPTAAG